MKPIRPLASFFVLVALEAVMIMWGAASIAAQASSAEECKAERRLAINACKSVIYGTPSPACCEQVRIIHVECVCAVITPKLAALIDVNHFIKLIEGCGRSVPRHFKCGSVTTP